MYITYTPLTKDHKFDAILFDGVIVSYCSPKEHPAYPFGWWYSYVVYPSGVKLYRKGEEYDGRYDNINRWSSEPVITEEMRLNNYTR